MSILQFTIIVAQMRLTKSKYKIIRNKGERSYPRSLITRLKTGFCWRVHLMPLLINYIGSLRANKPRIWATVLSVAFVTTGRTSSEKNIPFSINNILYLPSPPPLSLFLFRITSIIAFRLINRRTCLREIAQKSMQIEIDRPWLLYLSL